MGGRNYSLLEFSLVGCVPFARNVSLLMSVNVNLLKPKSLTVGLRSVGGPHFLMFSNTAFWLSIKKC